MTAAQRHRLAAVALAVALAGLLGPWVHPVAALAPLVVLGLPAGLLLWAGRGGRDAYDVRYRYPGVSDPPTRVTRV